MSSFQFSVFSIDKPLSGSGGQHSGQQYEKWNGADNHFETGQALQSR